MRITIAILLTALLLVACSSQYEYQTSPEITDSETADLGDLSWQEAYAKLLREYNERGANLFFILHDFDQSGIPELIVIGEYADNIYDVTYTFRNGEIKQLEYDEGVSIAEFALATRTALAVPPNNLTGILTFANSAAAGAFGTDTLYGHIIVDNGKLIIHNHGARLVDVWSLYELFDNFGRYTDNETLTPAIYTHTNWYINDNPVSSNEFRNVFISSCEIEKWLYPRRITEYILIFEQ